MNNNTFSAAGRTMPIDFLYRTYDDDGDDDDATAPLEKDRQHDGSAHGHTGELRAPNKVSQSEQRAAVTTFRRITACIVFALTLAYVSFAIDFQLEIQDQRSPFTSNTSLPFCDPSRSWHSMLDSTVLFTGAVGVLYLLALSFYLASKRSLFIRDATHVGAMWNLFLTCGYAFAVVMTFGWRLVGERSDAPSLHVEIVRRRNNWYVVSYAACMASALAAAVATWVVAGMLVGTVRGRAVDIVRRRRARRRALRRGRKAHAPHKSVDARSALPTFHVAEPLHSSQFTMSAAAAAAYAFGDLYSDTPLRHVKARARNTRYDYVFSPHRTLSKFNILSVTSTLTSAFLFVMSLLALLESQSFRVVTNLWAYAIVYGIVGLVLLAIQLIALIRYLRAHPELTFRHTLPINLNALVSFMVWASALFYVSTWISHHASGACCSSASVAVVAGVEPAWTFYNNAMASVGAHAAFLVLAFVPAATAHAYPERRAEVERSRNGNYISDDDNDETAGASSDDDDDGATARLEKRR